MLKSENVATPFTTATVFVPESVPGASVPPLWPIAMVTVPAYPVTGLPEASVTVTCTAGIVTSGSVVFGCAVKTRCGGGLRATTLASQLPGWENPPQVQRGSVVPAAEASR